MKNKSLYNKESSWKRSNFKETTHGFCAFPCVWEILLTVFQLYGGTEFVQVVSLFE